MTTKSEIRKIAAQAELAVEKLQAAMSEYFDDRSENWQTGDAGDDWQLRMDGLDSALDAIRDVVDD